MAFVDDTKAEAARIAAASLHNAGVAHLKRKTSLDPDPCRVIVTISDWGMVEVRTTICSAQVEFEDDTNDIPTIRSFLQQRPGKIEIRRVQLKENDEPRYQIIGLGTPAQAATAAE